MSDDEQPPGPKPARAMGKEITMVQYHSGIVYE